MLDVSTLRVIFPSLSERKREDGERRGGACGVECVIHTLKWDTSGKGLER
jgi:hypothetical protein